MSQTTTAVSRDTQTTSEQREAGSATVPVRVMDFNEWVANLPKYFAADGDIVMSHVLSVLSSTFPEGENFFVPLGRCRA